MAPQYSFDIVSEISSQEVDNAVNQAIKELRTRFDFKGSKSSIEYLRDENKIRLIADDDLKLKNLQDILRTRMVARKIPLNGLEFKDPEEAFQGTLRQDVELVQGISHEVAKDMIRSIKDARFKVQPALQGDKIRVSSKSKDELQGVMGHLKANPPKIPLQFINYR